MNVNDLLWWAGNDARDVTVEDVRRAINAASTEAPLRNATCALCREPMLARGAGLCVECEHWVRGRKAGAA